MNPTAHPELLGVYGKSGGFSETLVTVISKNKDETSGFMMKKNIVNSYDDLLKEVQSSLVLQHKGMTVSDLIVRIFNDIYHNERILNAWLETIEVHMPIKAPCINNNQCSAMVTNIMHDVVQKWPQCLWTPIEDMVQHLVYAGTELERGSDSADDWVDALIYWRYNDAQHEGILKPKSRIEHEDISEQIYAQEQSKRLSHTSTSYWAPADFQRRGYELATEWMATYRLIVNNEARKKERADSNSVNNNRGIKQILI